ncbi:radial spoke head 10 homolog B-like isoform X2 [Babylonia areolata]|uniref:radial spoke head 10 homolog B-like isoform X2 n=1 Tax=Babylonia areolata TaxID=304850 RepID=UPI003FD25F8F
MATKEKGKKGKDSKSAKKTEEALEEKKTETPFSEAQDSTSEEQTIIEEPPPKEPSPEPVYDEPVLPELIIELYEGEKVRGQYEGDGTCYFRGGHVYKGHFAEGFMHGRGKYTWSDGVEYEGDFFKNEITGKGMYRWNDGSTYDGDVVKGLRHGQGTFRWKDNFMSYTGDWDQGYRTGKGRVDYDSEGKSYYDGDLVKNIRHGWGVRQYPSGNMYKGMWFSNVRHGQGTMKWIDHNQIYNGQWENGIQHGMGQHIWLLGRVPGSQYPMRNMYDGELVNGLRHGFGTFHYANGASYSGYWKNNMKHGKGKFMFKNGRVYEGMFEHDHIVEYPDFNMDGATTPDLDGIRTRTPLPSDNVSVHSNESRNTVSPNFQLEIDNLLNELPEADREEEASQVLYVITRHISSLRKIYNYYSQLGYEESPDNTFTMTHMQFWRFLKDCRFHHHKVMLNEMDRFIGKNFNKANYELHNPYERILQRQFVNYLVILSYQIHGERFEESSPLLAKCLNALITENILRYACNVKGYFYYETRRAVNALVYMDQTYEIFQNLCKPRKYAPKEPAFRMREFLFLLKDLKLINSDLTPQKVLEVLSVDDPAVTDGEGCYNLELEMTFLEFFEALIGSAEIFATDAVVKDPTTPRPSTVMTQEPSVYSMPASPSRMTSQAGAEEGTDSAIHHTPHHHGISPVLASETPRAPSSGAATVKTTGEGSVKGEQAQTSMGNVLTTGSEHVGTEGTSQQNSARDGIEHMQKSASFVSTRTNATEDNQPLMHSVVSMGGQRYTGDEEEELGEGGHNVRTESAGGEEEEELDEETRRFNFWTHQVHIFFTRKFFLAAEHLIAIKRLVDSRRTEEELRRLSMAPSCQSIGPPAANNPAVCTDTNLPIPPTTGPSTPKPGGDSVASLRVAA